MSGWEARERRLVVRVEYRQQSGSNSRSMATVVALFACWLFASLMFQQYPRASQGRDCSDNFTCCHGHCGPFVCLLVVCLLNVPAIPLCISGTGLLRQFYVLLHLYRGCRSNALSHPITVRLGQPVPALALQHQAPRRKVIGVLICKSLV